MRITRTEQKSLKQIGRERDRQEKSERSSMAKVRPESHKEALTLGKQLFDVDASPETILKASQTHRHLPDGILVKIMKDMTPVVAKRERGGGERWRRRRQARVHQSLRKH